MRYKLSHQRHCFEQIQNIARTDAAMRSRACDYQIDFQRISSLRKQFINDEELRYNSPQAVTYDRNGVILMLNFILE
jgi:hypothetical protein